MKVFDSRVVLGKSEVAPRAAFTLIEMLISILIVAVLLALGGAAFKKSLEFARAFKCSNQLRQIGTGLVGYQVDHEMTYPPSFANSFSLDWSGIWYSPASRAGATEEPGLSAYVGGRTALQLLTVCPFNRDSVGGMIPNVNSQIGYPYIVNYYVLAGSGFSLRKSVSISAPSEIVVMMDSGKYPSWNIGFAGASEGMGFFGVSEKHSGNANILWADGHVTAGKKSTVTMENVVP